MADNFLSLKTNVNNKYTALGLGTIDDIVASATPKSDVISVFNTPAPTASVIIGTNSEAEKQKTVTAEPGPIDNSKEKQKEFIPGETPPPWKNELSDYSSFSSITTLSLLTRTELADPDGTYIKNGPTFPILKAGGGITRSNRTYYENQLDKDLEFFINDLEFDTIINAGSTTNATKFQFTVMEPYSMGLFLQALQVTAIAAGYDNYIGAPFMLQIDFIGHIGESQITAPYATRMLPIKLIDAQMSVTGAGTSYEIKAMPFNEQALLDQIQTIKTDISMKGKTVHELLQLGSESLASIINKKELSDQAATVKSTGDQFVIIFPIDTDSASSNPINSGSNSADVSKQSELSQRFKAYANSSANVNSIGTSTIISNPGASGTHPIGKNGKSYTLVDSDKTGIYKRGNGTIDLSKTERKFTFKSGTRIQEIINEVVLVSEYGQKLANQLKDNKDKQGMLTWFKIEAQTYLLKDDAQVAKTGTDPKVYVYRVVPYKVHSSILKSPTSPGKNYKNLKLTAAKDYNYIYTGKNQDILDFDIKYKYQFYTALRPDFGNNEAQATKGNTSKIDSSNTNEKNTSTQVVSSKNVKDTIPQVQFTDGKSKTTGGGGEENTATTVARMFQEQLDSSMVDMVMLELTIMGDPFYILDSGVGNYNAKKTQYTNMNVTGSMDYQSSEVDINITFKNPIDISDTSGLIETPDAEIVNGFSGLYKVTRVHNSISGNKFIQTLSLIRRLQQQTDTADTAGSAIATDASSSK